MDTESILIESSSSLILETHVIRSELPVAEINLRLFPQIVRQTHLALIGEDVIIVIYRIDLTGR